jgi:hypothetical protein
VAKNVAGQEWIKQQHVDPQHNPDAENQPKGAACRYALSTRCRERQQACGDGQGNKGIVAAGLEGKRCDKGQSCEIAPMRPIDKAAALFRRMVRADS